MNLNRAYKNNQIVTYITLRNPNHNSSALEIKSFFLSVEFLGYMIRKETDLKRRKIKKASVFFPEENKITNEAAESSKQI